MLFTGTGQMRYENKIEFNFSDDSDEPEGAPRHLPARMLVASASTRRRKKSAIGNKRMRLEADEDDDEDGEAGSEAGGDAPTGWRRSNPGLVGSKVPPFEERPLSAEDQEIIKDFQAFLQKLLCKNFL